MTAASPTTTPASDLALRAFTPEHIPGALRLSQEAGWPHRAEDWALTLSVSQGVVALRDGEVVGTALCSIFGEVASVNMIIVDARMRGHGLGRKLMQAVLDLAGTRELRLTATTDGLPLYQKLGFQSTGEILQHQGIALRGEPELPVVEGDADGIAAMDLAASGMERATLLAGIAERGTVLRAEGGFALLRDFGRGQLLGPVVARDLATARALLSAGATRAAGGFLRVDLTDPALADHATGLGLVHMGGGTAMAKGAAPACAPVFKTFALASQALG